MVVWRFLWLIGIASVPACGGESERSGGSAGAANAARCEYNGKSYAEGESFTAADGCNGCTCADGVVTCTTRDCNVCDDIAERWTTALAEAKKCSPPDGAAGCTQKMTAGLSCACDTFVNPAQSEAIDAVLAAQEEVREWPCFGPVACGPCNPPTTAACSANGECVDVFGTPGTGASCKVNGVVYPDGATGFPGIFGCNTCDCVDGTFSCTEETCNSACPPNGIDTTHCVECRPEGGCAVVEYGCVPVCSENSHCGDGQACVDSICTLACE